MLTPSPPCDPLPCLAQISENRRSVRLCVRALAAQAFAEACAARAEAEEGRLDPSTYWEVKQAQWQAQQMLEDGLTLPTELSGIVGRDATEVAKERMQARRKAAQRRHKGAKRQGGPRHKPTSFKVFVDFLCVATTLFARIAFPLFLLLLVPTVVAV